MSHDTDVHNEIVPPAEEEDEVTLTDVESRQGNQGLQMIKVLSAALALALIVGTAIGVWVWENRKYSDNTSLVTVLSQQAPAANPANPENTGPWVKRWRD